MRINKVRARKVRAVAREPLMLLIVSVVAIGLAAGSTAAAQSKSAKAAASKSKALHLPYATIDHPHFVPASQASFLGPKDIVLGVTDSKTAKAYPAAILAQHGVVQDSTADGPIAVTW